MAVRFLQNPGRSSAKSINGLNWQHYHSVLLRMEQEEGDMNRVTPMRQIIYVSTAVGTPAEEDLENLLLVARACNLRDGISGLLLYHDRTFMQVLEGPSSAVAATYCRIKRNGSHYRIQELVNKDVDQRIFPDWSMAFARPGREPDDSRSGRRSFSSVISQLHPARDEDAGTARLVLNYLAMFRDVRGQTSGWCLAY